MFKKYLLLYFITLSFIFNLSTSCVFAAATKDINFNSGEAAVILQEVTKTTGQDQIKSVPDVLSKIIRIFLGLSSTIFLIFLVSGGLSYLGSAGNIEKIKDSFNLIKTGIIGLAVILLAYSITAFVFSQILKISI